MAIDRDFQHEHLAMISVAEACWRKTDPSYSWHVFEWMAYKLRCKYPPVWGGGAVNMNYTGS